MKFIGLTEFGTGVHVRVRLDRILAYTGTVTAAESGVIVDGCDDPVFVIEPVEEIDRLMGRALRE